MNKSMSPRAIFASALEFVRPAFLQTAVICLRDGAQGREVMLIKTFQQGQWMIPKGWPMKNRTLAEAAAIEAWEESGVRGVISQEPMGSFCYTKLKKSGLPVQCRADVFVMQVTETHDDYPEARKRERRWVALAEAPKIVRNADLAALLRTV